MAREVEPQQRGGGLRPRHGLALVVVGVAGVLIAFWALSTIAGIIAGLVKAAVIIALVLGVLYVLLRRRS
jgi:hypothetical protein